MCLSSRIKRQETTAVSEHNACQLASRRIVRICLGGCAYTTSPENIICFSSWSCRNVKLMDHATQYSILARNTGVPSNTAGDPPHPCLALQGSQFVGQNMVWPPGPFRSQCAQPPPCARLPNWQCYQWAMGEKGGCEKPSSLMLACWQSSFLPQPWQPAFKLFLIPAKTLEAYKEGYVFQSFSNKDKLNKINILYILFWLKKKNIKYSHSIGT